MTEEEIRREILNAIVECEYHDQRGNQRPGISEVEAAKAIRDTVVERLKEKDLLKLDG